MKKIITRFAPSPTGELHIGGARTALFNYLFAKHHDGKFLLRIEDTDLKRSTEEAKQTIISSLEWLGLNWDDEIVYQHSRQKRHIEIANYLVDTGKAYRCYCEKLEKKEKSIWRDKSKNDWPLNLPYVVRLKAPLDGKTTINDLVQGSISIENKELDDMILLRSDNTPTYMLSVVVDDYDMGITHIIRGNDHLTNAFRQVQIYYAMGWEIPEYAHIPLINDESGKKLSKRNGAAGLDYYRKLGFIPEALRKYLLRLGWSHKNDEIIPTAKAIELFNLEAVGKSPASLNIKKMENLNKYYISNLSNDELLKMVYDNLSKYQENILLLALTNIKSRSKTLLDVKNFCDMYLHHKPINNYDLLNYVKDNQNHLINIKNILSSLEWNYENIKFCLENYSKEKDISFNDIMKLLRIVLTGNNISPPMNDILVLLEKEEIIQRINKILTF